MSRRRLPSPRVRRPNGQLDPDALQRTVDAIVGRLNELSDSPAGDLSSLPIRISTGTADPTVEDVPGTVGDLRVRVTADRTVAAVYLMSAPGVWTLIS